MNANPPCAATQLGAIVSFMESSLNIDLLSAEVYFISDLPTEVRTGEVVRICLIALALAVAATLYPAISASRQHPAEALHGISVGGTISLILHLIGIINVIK